MYYNISVRQQHNTIGELIMYFKEFHVTGVLRNGRRFKTMKFSSYNTAICINLWRGSVWGVKEDGSRKLLKRSYN